MKSFCFPHNILETGSQKQNIYTLHYSTSSYKINTVHFAFGDQLPTRWRRKKMVQSGNWIKSFKDLFPSNATLSVNEHFSDHRKFSSVSPPFFYFYIHTRLRCINVPFASLGRYKENTGSCRLGHTEALQQQQKSARDILTQRDLTVSSLCH